MKQKSEARKCLICNHMRPRVSFISGRNHCQVCEENMKEASVFVNENDGISLKNNELLDEQYEAAIRGFPPVRATSEGRTVERRSITMMRSILLRARDRGMACDLTLEWCRERLYRGACEVTGIRFVQGVRSPWNASVDRRDSAKGYTIDNCQMVVYMYNIAKMEWPEREVLMMARALCARWPHDADNDRR